MQSRGWILPLPARKRLTQAAGSEQLGRIKEKLFSRGHLEKEAEEPFFFFFSKDIALGSLGN